MKGHLADPEENGFDSPGDYAEWWANEYKPGPGAWWAVAESEPGALLDSDIFRLEDEQGNSLYVEVWVEDDMYHGSDLTATQVLVARLRRRIAEGKDQ